jgi:RNA polymerase sigma-70 factor (ECF subfamily)
VNKQARIETYLQKLYGYAFSLARDPHQAEDFVQECAVKALSAKNTPRDEPAYRAWLFRILRNTFFDQLRRNKTAASAMEDLNFYPEMEFWQGEERFISSLTVKLEMAKLPTSQREILALVDIAGLSYAETAETLGIPTGTVMSRISRSRRALLEAIEASNIHVLPVKKRNRN